MEASTGRAIIEENHRLLVNRKRYLSYDFRGAQVVFQTDVETSTVLASLSLDEVERVADCSVPLMGLSLDEALLCTLQGAPSVRSRADGDLLARGLLEENEDLLLNRWRAVLQGAIPSRIVYGLPGCVASWFLRATLAEVRSVAQAGHVCGYITVRPAYFVQAARCAHLGRRQRSNLALAASRHRHSR